VRVPRQTPLELGAPGTGPESLLPAVLAVDDCDSVTDVIDMLALAPFVAGDQPYATIKALDNVRDDATLLPPASRVLRESVWENGRTRLAAGDGWTLRAVHQRYSKTATVEATAVTAELSARIVALATEGMTEQPPPADEAVFMGFWYAAARGPQRHPRPITAAPWADIRPNYARSAATRFDGLMKVDRESVRGRLLLLYGPPGTGKTTVLRALAREWRDWCRFDCVLDPDTLFGSPAYLMEVALNKAGDGDGEDEDEKWRMLLLEDCDELIRGEAKQHTGQALSRLLNLTDGLLGQGRQVLVAITTNEDVARLHPAVVRPGRCLAHIEVPALSYAEASTWLGTSAGVPAGGATLAELYALRDGHQPAIDREPVLDGQYL
jgi:Domain of unknown function (DUF5925)/ATPase family associated with various cellular activities (AAA)